MAKHRIDLPERVVFTPTPEPLMQLCLECRRARCNGEKCDDYKNLERKIRMNTSGKMQRKLEPDLNTDLGTDATFPPLDKDGAPVPVQSLKIEIVMPAAPPHEAVAQARGLKLWNLTIEALDKLLDEEDMAEGSGSFAGMLKALKMQRFSLYGNRVDWHALEDE